VAAMTIAGRSNAGWNAVLGGNGSAEHARPSAAGGRQGVKKVQKNSHRQILNQTPVRVLFLLFFGCHIKSSKLALLSQARSKKNVVVLPDIINLMMTLEAALARTNPPPSRKRSSSHPLSTPALPACLCGRSSCTNYSQGCCYLLRVAEIFLHFFANGESFTPIIILCVPSLPSCPTLWRVSMRWFQV
jgi:hypothetical protein